MVVQVNGAYKFSITNRRSITVKSADLHLFKDILAHGTVPSSMVHDLYRIYVNQLASSSVISNRLAKMREARLLARIDVPYTFNGKVLNRSFYQVGERALNQLQDMGWISAEEHARGIEIAKTQRVPSAQELTGSLIVHDVFQQVEELGEVNLAYTRSEVHPLFQKEYRYKEQLKKTGHWPEWILETEFAVICLFRNVTVILSHSILELAMNRDFLEIATEVKKLGKNFVIFYSVYDGSDQETMTKVERDLHRHVFSVKEMMPHVDKWAAHYDVLVLPLKRTVSKLVHLVHPHFLLDADENLPSSIQSIFPHLNYQGWHYEFVAGWQVEKNNAVIHERHQFVVNGQRRLIWMYYAEEGSVRTFRHLKHLTRSYDDWTFDGAQVEKPDELWIVYATDEAAQADTLELYNLEKIWLTSVEAWERISRRNFQFPEMFRMASRSFYRRQSAAYLNEPIAWVEDFSHLYLPTIKTTEEFFNEQLFLIGLKAAVNHGTGNQNRWVWRPRSERGDLLADILGEVEMNGEVQHVFVLQEKSFEDVVEHGIELLAKWSQYPEMFESIGFKSSMATQYPLLIIRLNAFEKLDHALKQLAVFSSAYPFLLDAPIRNPEYVTAEMKLPVVYWLQNNEVREYQKLDLGALIAWKMTNPE